MAYSEDTNFSMTSGEIIKKALQKIAVLEEGEEPNSTQYTDGLVDLNMLIKAMSRYGLNIWAIRPMTLDELFSGTARYDYGPTALFIGKGRVSKKPISILEASIKDPDDNETTLTPLTRQEYDALPNKTTPGKPTQFFFEPTIPNSQIYFWPVPDDTYNSANGYTVETWVQYYIDDSDAISDDLYFPSEWFEAIVYQLAIRIASDYGVPLQERKMLEVKADQYLKETLDWDTEHESIYIRPEIRWQK